MQGDGSGVVEYEARIDFNFVSTKFYNDWTKRCESLVAGVRRRKYTSHPKDLRLTSAKEAESKRHFVEKYNLGETTAWHLRTLVVDEGGVMRTDHQIKITTSLETDYFALGREALVYKKVTSLELTLTKDDWLHAAPRLNNSARYGPGSSLASRPPHSDDQLMFHMHGERFTLTRTVHPNERIQLSFHIECEFGTQNELTAFDPARDLSPFAREAVYVALADTTRGELYDFVSPLCAWRSFNLNGSRAFTIPPAKDPQPVRYVSPKLDGTRLRGVIICGHLMVPSGLPVIAKLAAAVNTLGLLNNYFVVVECCEKSARIVDVLGTIEVQPAYGRAKIINTKHHTLVSGPKMTTFCAIDVMKRWGTDVCNTFQSPPVCNLTQLIPLLLFSDEFGGEKIDGYLGFCEDGETIYKLKKTQTVELEYTVTSGGRVVIKPPDGAGDYFASARFIMDEAAIVEQDAPHRLLGRPLIEFGVVGDRTLEFVRFRFDKCKADSFDKVKEMFNKYI